MVIDRLTQMANELEALERVESERKWVQYTTGLDFGVAEAARKTQEFKKDKAHFKLILDARESSARLALEDKRRVDILHLAFQGEHLSERASRLADKVQELETQLTQVRNQFRRTLDGKELDPETISRIMNDSPDRELRRRVYETWFPLNRLVFEAGFAQLIELRKEYAEARGARDFVSLKLEEDEVSPVLFSGWREAVLARRERFRQAWRAFGEEFLGGEEPAPWDQGYLRTQMSRASHATVEMLEFQVPITKLFAKYGFEMSGLNLTYDVFPRKNKAEWGACFVMQSGKEARILANVSKRFASFWVLLHETAHAVHFLGLDPEESILNRGVSGIISEGFANFFGDCSYSRDFVEEVFPQGEVEGSLAQFARLRQLEGRDVLSIIALTLFDQELYRQKIENLDDVNQLAWSVDREIRAAAPFASEPAWAVTQHHISVPVYLHNYVLGDIVGAQMKKTFINRTGLGHEESSERFGRFWYDELLKPSGLFPFEELCRRAFGGQLDLGAYLDQCLAL